MSTATCTTASTRTARGTGEVRVLGMEGGREVREPGGRAAGWRGGGAVGSWGLVAGHGGAGGAGRERGRHGGWGAAGRSGLVVRAGSGAGFHIGMMMERRDGDELVERESSD